MTMLTQKVNPTETGRWRWTRADCLFMENAGLLKGRYELIDGEIINKTALEGRKHWTRQECEFLENAGLLTERYELIDGEILSKMGQHPPHAFAIMRVLLYLASLFGGDRIRSQATMEVHDQERITNQPEPDAVVLREESLRIPTGADVLLVVEVSDTTAGYDLGAKVGLYARAGIEEYWVLDINRRLLLVFRHPQGDHWQERTVYTEDESLAPVSAPNSFIRVGDLLPPGTE